MGPEAGAEDDRADRLGVDLELIDDAANGDGYVDDGMELDADETVDGVLISEDADTATPPVFFDCKGSGVKVEHPNVSDGVCFGFRLAMVAKT